MTLVVKLVVKNSSSKKLPSAKFIQPQNGDKLLLLVTLLKNTRSLFVFVTQYNVFSVPLFSHTYHTRSS